MPKLGVSVTPLNNNITENPVQEYTPTYFEWLIMKAQSFVSAGSEIDSEGGMADTDEFEVPKGNTFLLTHACISVKSGVPGGGEAVLSSKTLPVRIRIFEINCDVNTADSMNISFKTPIVFQEGEIINHSSVGVVSITTFSGYLIDKELMIKKG
tara:strand:+ start:429 stop:890 length:462 start_codon:yes stop_codon:yes gene_type:complete